MGTRTNIALLTGVAGLGFVMMGCPPAEEPPPGERIVEPAPRTTDPTEPTQLPQDDWRQEDPQDPPPLEPEPTEPDPLEPDPLEPDPLEPDPLEPDPAEPDPYGPGGN